MLGSRRRHRVTVGGFVALLAFTSHAPRATAESTHPVEAHFAAPGPHGVARASVPDGTGGTLYELVLPDDLGAGGAPAPIITWGNGSFATPAEYPGLLDHLASWGFVVVATTTTEAGTGDEMRAALAWLLNDAHDPASRFHGVIDPEHIGAMGHSQGAGGTVRAATMSGGLIDTTVTVALPNPVFVTPLKNNEYDPSKLPGPALFLGGTEDVISPALVNRWFFDQAQHGSAIAMLNGADHNAIQGTGGGFLGYVAAWFRYQLMDDAVAARAFTGSDPELLANPAFSSQAVKDLAPPSATMPARTPTPVVETGAPTPGAGPSLPASGAEVPVGLAALAVAAALATRWTIATRPRSARR